MKSPLSHPLSPLSHLLSPLSLLLSLLALPAWAQVHTWEPYEITLTAAGHYENPYANIPAAKGKDLVTATFTGPEGRSLTMTGFWDGGQTWRIRFAPPAPGTWTYTTTSQDRGLNGKKGTITVAAWTEADRQANRSRHGFIHVRATGEQAGHIFEHADGTPFLWIGDTWWNWTKRGIYLSTFRKLADDRSAKGFTVGQLFVAANGWGRESSLLDERYDVLDVHHMQHVDSMIQYANAKGITVWVHAWWSREGLDKAAGPEKMRRWWRYLVHRLGAYNVTWVLAGEYNLDNYGGLGLDFWKDLGTMLQQEDPYRRMVGAHNTPPGWSGGDGAPQWSTSEVLGKDTWLDYNQSQVGHGKWRNELIPDIVARDYALVPARPIVVTEPWYEFIEGNPTGMDIRFGAWSAVLSGAAGHTYGGGQVWRAHVPERPGGKDSWPQQMDFERTTLDYEGARSMGYLSKFMQGIDWWHLAPHPELLHETADPYCAAIPGEEYVAYLRWGGGVKVDLRPSSASDVFEGHWFNPATGEHQKARTVPGGAIRYFGPAEDYPSAPAYHDWVLYIRKRS